MVFHSACVLNMESKLLKVFIRILLFLCFSVRLPLFKDPLPKLRRLLELKIDESIKFRENIRAYTSMVSMAAKAITGKMTQFDKWQKPFKMSGSMHHLAPHVFPETDQKPNLCV